MKKITRPNSADKTIEVLRLVISNTYLEELGEELTLGELGVLEVFGVLGEEPTGSPQAYGVEFSTTNEAFANLLNVIFIDEVHSLLKWLLETSLNINQNKSIQRSLRRHGA